MVQAIIHIDMDAFYASVEQRDDPRLKGKPVIVGGHPKRGVVLAASYEVRPYGVRSAMPMAVALRLAPEAVVVPPRFSAYAEASAAVFSIFERYTPEIEPLSLDEAFLDVTASQTLFGAAGDIARAIRASILREVSLPASAGVAAVKFVAKIASDLAKPNGQCEISSADTVSTLAPLPISRLWGVGPKSEARLRAKGVQSIGDIHTRGRRFMEQSFGPQGAHLWQLSQGIDTRRVEPDREAKSIGAEDTFEVDVEIGENIYPHLHSQAIRVASRLRKASLVTRVVQLKLKLSDFTLITRRCTLDIPTDDGQMLYNTAVSLLEKAPHGTVRLTGLSAQEIAPSSRMGSLFPTDAERLAEKRTRLNRALDAIADKFGTPSVTTADLLDDTDDDAEDMARRAVGAARFDRR